MKYKVCTKCKKEKEINLFYFDLRRNKAVSSCKDCILLKQKQNHKCKTVKKIINFENEVWKPVFMYESKYHISNLGRIKSLNYNHTGKESLMKLSIDKGGYYIVGLSDLSKGIKLKTFKIHQLVAIAFLNHKPCGMELVINHINFNKLDNCVENLEIVTSRENTNKKHIKSSSKYVGVAKATGSNWIAYIYINRKRKYLGFFKSEYDAHLAYEKALKEHNKTQKQLH